MKNENGKYDNEMSIEVSYDVLSVPEEQPTKFTYGTDLLDKDSSIFAAAFIKQYHGIPLPIWVKHFRADGTVKFENGFCCSNLFTKLGLKNHTVDVQGFKALIGQKS